METQLMQGDCLEVMKDFESNSIDAIITDPPYGLSAARNSGKKSKGGFMGKAWDYDVPKVEVWAECLRVLKPGGHLLSFAGTRTQHRMCCNIEDAGFEIRDMIAWVYSTGFPKSLNISKKIDQMAFHEWLTAHPVEHAKYKEQIKQAKGNHELTERVGRKFRKMAGVEREVVGVDPEAKRRNKGPMLPADKGWNANSMGNGKLCPITSPATPAAKQWDGWHTSLKSALEPITLARKPISEKTIAANVLKWSTGGINVDGCRVGTEDDLSGGTCGGMFKQTNPDGTLKKAIGSGDKGRFPANLLLSYPEDEFDANGKLLPNPGKDEVVGMFPETGNSARGVPKGGNNFGVGNSDKKANADSNYSNHSDSGSAARYFYCAKASKRDRDEGLEGMEGMEDRENQSLSLRHDKHCKTCGKKIDDLSRDSRPKSRCFCTDQREPYFKAVKAVPRKNTHCCVKPTKLMQYLCRLITPPDGIVLDPFMGSGSTGKACIKEGFNFIGIEMEPEYFEIAKKRIEAAKGEFALFDI